MENKDRAIDFINNIEGDIGIYFHNDADGVCSAVLMLNMLLERGLKPKLYCTGLDLKDFEKINLHDNCIIVDLAIDQYPILFNYFRKSNVLIVDHHPISTDLNKIGFIHVNPRFEAPNKYISASEICWILYKELGDENLEWVARVGATGDNSIEGTNRERKAAEICAAVKALKKTKGLISLAKFMSKCKNISEFLKNEDYLQMRSELINELDKQIALFEISTTGDPIFFQVKSKYSILSTLINRAFEEHPKKTLIFYRKSGPIYKISGRSKKYDLGKLFNKASKGIGVGGGHPVAAGAEVRDFMKFKTEILKLTKKSTKLGKKGIFNFNI